MRAFGYGVTWLVALGVAFASPTGCDSRPLVAQETGHDGWIGNPRPLTEVDKIDLLLVIDDSPGTADKQRELARTLPGLLRDVTTSPVHRPAAFSNGHDRAVDVHVAVLTTSLGSHGTSACAPSVIGEHGDGHGHLLPRAGDASCDGAVVTSALSWVFDPKHDPTATFSGVDVGPFANAASCVVQSAADTGCTYEETWESMYHFLVDPQPYLHAEVKCSFGATGDECGTNKIEVSGVDDEILKERKAFLRNDSILAVIVLSDENDVSLKPAQLNWLPWGYGAGQMQRGWTGCASVPDDFEPETGTEYNDLHTKYGCFSCFENTTDPACGVPWARDAFDADRDGRAIRGFHMVQRFGYNFLWSRQRYVDAFKNGTVPGIDASGALVGLANPIFAGGFRTPDLILVSAIVGVPPQLLADDAGKPKTLTESDWAGITSPDLTLRDPHMVESIAPRVDLGLPLYDGDAAIDPVNGGERHIEGGDDLQYACIGKRAVEPPTEDCWATDGATKNPLCGPRSSQRYFKAYPGLRHLRIVHDLGTSGLAASICEPSYESALTAIGARIHQMMASGCFRSLLSQDPETGHVTCDMVEVRAGDEGGKHCEDVGHGLCTYGAAPCRDGSSDTLKPMSPTTAADSLNLQIDVTGATGVTTAERVQATSENGNVYAEGSDGVRHLVCLLQQVTDRGQDPAVASACLRDPSFDLPAGAAGGWCYTTDPTIVGDACISIGAPGTLRFLGDAYPPEDASVFPRCVNEAAPAPASSP